MIILGIDPALTNLGWAIIEIKLKKLSYIASGTLKTKSSDVMVQRLAYIVLSLEELIAEYKPGMVAMEETFVNMNPISSLKLGFVRGAIMALIGKYNLDLVEFKPNKIKKTIVGIGHAEKHQILHMIKILLPKTDHITNFDEADALAVAYNLAVQI
jgi:crossover junction endodeoxyribonuclease RuvC